MSGYTHLVCALLKDGRASRLERGRQVGKLEKRRETVPVKAEDNCEKGSTK